MCLVTGFLEYKMKVVSCGDSKLWLKRSDMSKRHAFGGASCLWCLTRFQESKKNIKNRDKTSGESESRRKTGLNICLFVGGLMLEGRHRSWYLVSHTLLAKGLN